MNDIATAAVRAKARVRELAEQAHGAVEAAAAEGKEALRKRLLPADGHAPHAGSPLPDTSSFQIEGIDEALFDESAFFDEAQE